MRKWALTALAVLPLALAGGLIYANSQDQKHEEVQTKAKTYTCPLTGEDLPCPNCCPLNQKK
jgi:hypothetical protein